MKQKLVLRRGWIAKSYREAELGTTFNATNTSTKAYVNSLSISRNGDTYQIKIITPDEYASYVEIRNRTRNHRSRY